MYQAEEAEAMDQESPEEAEDGAEEEVPEEEVPEVEAEEPAPVDVVEEVPVAEPKKAPSRPKPVEAVEAEVPVAPVAKAPVRQPVTAQALDNDDAFFAQDVQRGMIKPETMQDLFAKKDTLGKIGTIFGLLVGGFGSGLSHQPNALLEAMKNEINNDLEAQKVSNANAQNWLRLSQAHEMQKAQIGQIGVQNELARAQTGQAGAQTEYSKAQTGKIPAEIRSLDAAAQAQRADTNFKNVETGLSGEKLKAWRDDDDFKATATTPNKMNIATVQYLTDLVAKTPPGPTKDAAVLALKTVTDAVLADNSKNNQNIVGRLNVRAAIRGDNKPVAEDLGGVNMQALNAAIASGNRKTSIGAPLKARKDMSASEAAKATAEADVVKENRTLLNAWKDSFEHLDKKAAGGSLNEQDRKAAIELLSAQISKTTGASSDVAKKQAEALFPAWSDWGTARQEKIKKGMEHFLVQEAKTTTLDRFGLKEPFPAPPALSKGKKSETKSTAAPKEGQTATQKSTGKPIIYQNGKWVPK